jgi:hypothetical protein
MAPFVTQLMVLVGIAGALLVLVVGQTWLQRWSTYGCVNG